MIATRYTLTKHIQLQRFDTVHKQTAILLIKTYAMGRSCKYPNVPNRIK